MTASTSGHRTWGLALLLASLLAAFSHAAPAGALPAGMPQRLTVGLFEDTGQTWMRDSGVPWDVRYRYLTKGWVNNWGWGAADGSFALDHMRESDAQGFMPAFAYYQLFAEPGGGEAQTLAKVRDPALMRAYFGDVKLLLQRAKEFGKPVLVVVEPDAMGFLQHQAGSNPSAPAAIASSGMPELAGLPNTVVGWSLAILQLRKAAGASNVVLALHVSGWASGKDIATGSVTDPLQPEVDKVAAFLRPAGAAANVTGQTYELLSGDPLDRDADYYRLTRGEDRWWDASDAASVSSKSFNRYAEWLRLMNASLQKRWVLWQIPLGNSNSANVANNGSARSGYKDNRTEYFFGPSGDAHRRKFVDVGVVSLLFGAGEGAQATHRTDQAADGQGYMQSRAGAFLKAGGLPLGGAAPAGDGGVAADAGVPPGGGGDAGTPAPDAGVRDAGTAAPDAGTPTGTGDTAQYHFESGTQGWARSSGSSVGAPTTSTARAYAGLRSLAVPFTGTAGTSLVRVAAPAVPAGRTVTFRLWLPSGSRVTSVQAYALEGAAGGWRWTGAWRSVSQLTPGAWNTLTLTLPANAAALDSLGVEIATNAGSTGSVHLDAVRW